MRLTTTQKVAVSVAIGVALGTVIFVLLVMVGLVP